ncbi:galactosyltransferase-domain-containing protein [Mycotypha africana]|uniref:galactosyltransferase-domain-containing protein n=1 Tax=Mycotypha africana TaxID=64632 RepID=UPI0023010AFD|nr:galactosyltransferase-domain-containing protein [Mycotypha africana]KAI8987671.1 galactosyltransferase-domain-containing protein [Mycotypha africana]
MAQTIILPFLRQKKSKKANLNVPSRYELPLSIIRSFSFLPSLFNLVHNLKQLSQLSYPAVSDVKILRTETYVACLWCLLSGYWTWTLSRAMLDRWLYTYEVKNAATRLLVFIIVTGYVLNLISSSFVAQQKPLLGQLIICFALLSFNVLKLKFTTDWKYQKMEDVLPTSKRKSDLSSRNSSSIYNNTAARVLLLPLVIVMGLSILVLSDQVYLSHHRNVALIDDENFLLDHDLASGIEAISTAGGAATILVLIISSWSSEAAQRRHALRETTINWINANRPDSSNIIYRFVIGQPPSYSAQRERAAAILKESEKYHDMLMVPASDLRVDKSQKLFQALRWTSIAQIKYDYLVKTDDDVFIRFDKLREEYTKVQDNHWRGFVYRNLPTTYFRPSKFEREVDYTLPILPKFTSGTFILLSSNVVKMIIETNYPQKFVEKDDVNLSLWLFGFNVNPTHDKRIQDDSDVCEEDFLAQRMSSLQQLKTMYSNIINQKPQCTGLNSQNKCALCYSCYEKATNWRAENFHCTDEQGVSFTYQPEFKKIASPNVKDPAIPSIIGVNDEWIIKDVLSARTSVYTEDEENWHLLYWVCWTSDPSTFTDRHWRALEMVWIHEPNAVIFMISNSLPQDFFNDYTRRGYRIHVVNFNKENLLRWHWYFGAGTLDWIKDWEKWENGKFFYWHLTDYIRCLLLYNYGGTYMDMDALWIRVPPNNQLEFIGSDYSQILSDRAWTLNDKGLYLPQGVMRFKRGWKLFREMAENAFTAYAYDPDCFNCGGPKAITSYVRDRRMVLEEAGFTILPPEVLYPINYLDIHKLLEPDPLAEQELRSSIAPFTWNIHLFGKMTNHLPIQPVSVIDYVFKKFDLDIPHRDTTTSKYISSTGTSDVPLRLMGPRDYIYRAISETMLKEDEQKGNSLKLQSVPGKFQGLDIIYIRGGPDRIPRLTIEAEAAVANLHLSTDVNNNSGSYERRIRYNLEDVSMQEVNAVLNSIEYRPTNLMLANGGRDHITVKIIFEDEKGAIREQQQLDISVVVIEPAEEDVLLNSDIDIDIEN